MTSGLLASLDDAEVEAVLGHELTHIRNGDVRMLVIAVIIAGVIGGLISFGIVGLFVGPVVLAVTYTLLLDWVNDGAPRSAPVPR